MSSDDDDLLSYTPLQRSQVSSTQKRSKPDVKPSKLSLSRRSQTQTTKNSSEVDVKPVKKTTPSKVKKRISKSTPVKSRADKPEENCSEIELAKWRFLFGSEVGKVEQKPRFLITKNGPEGESQREAHTIPPSQKRKSDPEEIVHWSGSKKANGGVCSHCKFPYSSLELKAAHSAHCKFKDLSHQSKCPEGAKCSSTEEVHYWVYNHMDQPKKTLEGSSRVPTETGALDGPVDVGDTYNSSTNDSGFNGAAGFFTPKKSSEPEALCNLPDFILSSDPEEHDDKSVPLFDLDNKDHETQRDITYHTRQDSVDNKRRDSVASRSTAESSTLLDLPLIPDIDLIEDDDATVYFGEGNELAKCSIFNEEQREENPPSPVTRPQDNDSCGTVTPDLENIEAEQDEAGDLEDSEGDELVGSVVEEAVSNFAIPVLEKVLKWREETKEALAATPQENRQNPQSRRSHRRPSPPPCIHLHFHEASPAPAPSLVRESGQTSILQFFKSTKPKEESCICGGRKTVTNESVAAWKGGMRRMQKRGLVSLPSISDSSSQDLRSDGSSKSCRQKLQIKTCPFYKYIPETNFVVDAFNYGTLSGVTAYFLSHFHYDHYVGLRRDFNQPIYCSEITARLVNKKLGVPLRYLNPLPMWEAQQVHGVEVTLLSANHCPGSVMFLFKVKPGVTHLHVGDFRAHPLMESYTVLHCPINTLFLDTTYCSPEYDFPSQEEIIEKCASVAQDHHQENNKTLFVVGSYTIGKERVFRAIAERLNCSIWVRSYKKQILSCIDDREILSRLTDNRTKAKVHVLSMSEIKGEKLREYLNQLKPSFTEIVGLCPTGWEFTGTSKGRGLDQITSHHPFPDVYIYGIPYSEHSSFSELRKFVQFIKPRKIVPTVNNGNQAARKKMEKYFREWLAGRQLFH